MLEIASPSYALPVLPLALAGRLEHTTVAVLRFDARLFASGLSTGWQSRCNMPMLIDLFLSRPLVSVGPAAKLIGVTPKSIDLMLNSWAAPYSES
jgi:hypothetical protein